MDYCPESTLIAPDTLCRVVEEFRDLQDKHPDLRIVGPDILSGLSRTAQNAIDTVSRINPSAYGVNHRKVPTSHTSRLDLIPVNNMGQKTNACPARNIQYLTPSFYAAFNELRSDVYRELGHVLGVPSGYRSAIYQAITFLRSLKENNGSVKKTVRRVAPPGFSEHNNIRALAADFDLHLPDGTVISGDNFGNTEAFDYIEQHSETYGLTLSFPPGNPYGVDPEPWHWRIDS